MSYPDDPGGNFASDVHRRVLGHLPLPGDDSQDAEAVDARIAADQYTQLLPDEVVEVLEDLEADGHASQSDGGWKQTEAGLETLNAEVVDDGE